MGQQIQIGDLVTRPSHGGDLVFEVIQINESQKTAILRGRDMRLMADAPLDDLEVYTGKRKITEDRGGRVRQKRFQTLIESDQWGRRIRGQARPVEQPGTYGEIYGSVLHLDGDKGYLEECLVKYHELKIEVNGYYIDEAEQPARIQELLLKHRPDVLVVTGHDGMKRNGGSDLNSYYSSRYFIESVKKAREIAPDKDSLVIFAGACQSFYEALIAAGANFASSPKRINIHTFDPVKVAETVAQTSIRDIVSLLLVIENSITGSEGVGGIESRGKMRRTLPKI